MFIGFTISEHVVQNVINATKAHNRLFVLQSASLHQY